MELLTLAKGLLQEAAEYAAGYKIGQVALRTTDRLLWVVEKGAKWAVPPPIDQDERPQSELVRPLPWVFFFLLLIALRLTRETMSIVNLFLGKPPLRSADVVMYIQSKRRYIRALKYQGSRNMRARMQNRPSTQSWMESLRYLVEFTTCFKRQPHSYGNNNTTHHSNNDETSNHQPKRNRDQNNDKTMELLIQKMMVNMNTDSDDDSSYVLISDQSIKSNPESSVTEAETMDSMSSDVATSTPVKSSSNQDPGEDTTIGEEALLSHIDTSDKMESQKLIQNEVATNKKTPPKKQKIANGQALKSSPKRKKGVPSERRDSDVPAVRITPTETNNNGTDVIRRAERTD